MNREALNALVAETLGFETKVNDDGVYMVKPHPISGDDYWTTDIPDWCGDLNYAFKLLQTSGVDFSIDYYNNNGSGHCVVSIDRGHICQNIKSIARTIVGAWLMYKGVDSTELLGLWSDEK